MAPKSHPGRLAKFPAKLSGPLTARGFSATGGGFVRDGMWLEVSPRWIVLHTQSTEHGAGALPFELDGVGLWKSVPNGSTVHQVFELPAWVISDPAEDSHIESNEVATFESLLDWALESSVGQIPAQWQPPARDVVESWLPRGALTVQADGLVRQGELILRPDRWALRIPILPQLPAALPAIRTRALRELCSEAQSRWAMVRLGIPQSSGNSALVAGVDFTGAPHSELLFSAGLDVLRLVVAGLVETVDVLADASVVIESLAIDCDITNHNERNTP